MRALLCVVIWFGVMLIWLGLQYKLVPAECLCVFPDWTSRAGKPCSLGIPTPQDQVMALQALGIKAAMLSSSDSREAG